jgi:hypothetical protein
VHIVDQYEKPIVAVLIKTASRFQHFAGEVGDIVEFYRFQFGRFGGNPQLKSSVFSKVEISPESQAANELLAWTLLAEPDHTGKLESKPTKNVITPTWMSNKVRRLHIS